MARISRRSLLTTGAAAGVLAASGMALMAAPRQGGVLRASVTGGIATDTWDSRTHSGLFMIVAGHGMVFDCLTEVGADGALKGELAESWEASADARIWTFNLRKDARFHNGKRFGADDVIESMTLHMGADSRSPAAPLLAPVAKIKKITEHQVQFHLEAPNADFPYLLADYHLVIYPAGYVELAMQNGIGTGLYRVETFRPGAFLHARRVDEHYKDKSAGFFSDVELTNEAVDGLRFAALDSGSADVVAQVPHGYASATAGQRVHNVSGNRHVRFVMDRRVSPFDRSNLRAALKLGVNRETVLQHSTRGHGRLGLDTPVGPANQYFARDLEPIPHDPDKARHLLRRTGVDRIALGMSGVSLPETDVSAALVQKQLRHIGLDVEMRGAREGASLATGVSSGRVTEDWVFSAYYAQGAAWNDSGWAHPRFEYILRAARAELDSKRRRAHYRDLQELLRNEGSVIIPAFLDHVFATRESIGTPRQMGNLWALDNARMAERWWRT